MTLPNKRPLNFLGLAICAAMMAYALYSQYVDLLDPCPLCSLQRLAVILLGIVFLLAALHNAGKTGGRVYAALIALIASTGAGVAGWHVYLQNLPPDEVPSCGPGLDYMMGNFPLLDVFSMIFQGSGECAEVSWRLLGLSMPAWVLIGVAGLGIAGVWNNLRQ